MIIHRLWPPKWRPLKRKIFEVGRLVAAREHFFDVAKIGIENIFKLHEDKLATKMAVSFRVCIANNFAQAALDRESQLGGVGLGTC